MWECPKCKRTFKNMNQSHYCSNAENIDEYIARQPAEVQPILQAVRETIRTAVPDATEKIVWSMPFFWRSENLIGFAALKNHISLFPGEAAVIEFTERLEGYNASKGTIQLPLDKSIDHALITDIVQWVSEKR